MAKFSSQHPSPTATSAVAETPAADLGVQDVAEVPRTQFFCRNNRLGDHRDRQSAPQCGSKVSSDDLRQVGDRWIARVARAAEFQGLRPASRAWRMGQIASGKTGNKPGSRQAQ